MARVRVTSGVSTSTSKLELKEMINRITKEDLISITAEVAIHTRKDVQARGYFPTDKSDYLSIVDRKHGHGKEYNVRPGGRITYQNNTATIDEVLEWIRDKIVALSPKRSGAYLGRHRMLIDGQGSKSVKLSSWTSGKLPSKYQWSKRSATTAVTFVNDQIYARRIERGGYTTKGNFIKPWSSQAPSGVYRSITRLAKIRFGQTVRIDFKYVKLASARKVSFLVRDTKRGSRKMGETLTAEAMYPSIRVRARTTTKGVTIQ